MNCELRPATAADFAIGTAIVTAVVEAAHVSGRSCRLHVLRANARARALYERPGFRELGGDEYRRCMRAE